MDQELARLAEERKAVAKQRDEAAAVRRHVDQRDAELKEREAAFRRKLTDRIDERVRTAAREIDAVVQALKRQTSALATREIGQPRLSTGDQGSLKAHARAAVEAAAAQALDPGARSPEPEARTPKPEVRSPESVARPASVGDRVIVPPFGLEGIVKSISDGQAEVDVNGKRLRAAAKAPDGARRKPAAAPATVRVNIDLAERSGSLSDLNVIGCTVDEALDTGGAASWTRRS